MFYCIHIHIQCFKFVAFVHSEVAGQFPNLEVKYVRGADPVIKLLDDDKKVVETLSIEKWNTDSVEEFLHERLR